MCRAMQVRFNRVPDKVPEKVPGSFGAKPRQVQGSREGSGEGLGGFGAEPEPGQVQQGSGEGSGEGLGGLCAEPCRSGSTGFRTRFRRRFQEALVQSQGRSKVPEKVPVKVWEALVQSQSQVRFNRVPEKVPEKVLEACVQSHAGQVQQGSGQGSGEGSRKLWCKAKAGSTGSSTWLGSTLQKRFVKIKRRGCWGSHRRLFFQSGGSWQVETSLR